MKAHSTYLDPSGLVHFSADMSDRYNCARYAMCERRETHYQAWGDRELFTTSAAPTCLPCVVAGDVWNSLPGERG
jgi:hypothetical protein